MKSFFDVHWPYIDDNDLTIWIYLDRFDNSMIEHETHHKRHIYKKYDVWVYDSHGQ